MPIDWSRGDFTERAMNWEPTTSPVIAYPLWVRAASALTAVSVFILLAIGTLVTTFGVGMADTVWPTPPWYLLFHERAGNFGWYVEHAHRIAGYAVGFSHLADRCNALEL
jgi:heme A synthase